MKLLGSLLIIVILTGPIPLAFGQTVGGSIVAGFGGYYRIGKCMPIKIHLENSGSDLAGDISIQISQTTFSQEVSLPSPSRKTFTFYIVPPKYIHELEVKLFSNGKLLKVFSSVLRRVPDDELLVVRSATLKQLSTSDNSSLPSRNEKTVFVDLSGFSRILE